MATLTNYTLYNYMHSLEFFFVCFCQNYKKFSELIWRLTFLLIEYQCDTSDPQLTELCALQPFSFFEENLTDRFK